MWSSTLYFPFMRCQVVIIHLVVYLIITLTLLLLRSYAKTTQYQQVHNGLVLTKFNIIAIHHPSKKVFKRNQFLPKAIDFEWLKKMLYNSLLCFCLCICIFVFPSIYIHTTSITRIHSNIVFVKSTCTISS